jgi:hypothetical protein
MHATVMVWGPVLVRRGCFPAHDNRSVMRPTLDPDVRDVKV